MIEIGPNLKRNAQEDLEYLTEGKRKYKHLPSYEMAEHWINRATDAEKLIEQAAEEIENCYGKETELSKKMRDFLGGSINEQ